MLEKDKLFNRMKILCEKLEAASVPSSIEHAQEILRKWAKLAVLIVGLR